MKIHNTIKVKSGECPTIKSLFECLGVGDTLVLPYERKRLAAVRQECFRQNEIARALGGRLNLFFRTMRLGDEILIYKLK